eukprot:TRINITY_DN5380_c0_g1_i1.p2 TRINITY_DN5380_c0_g1~~TRINITY_DN5380_c0_g1_i1.p2  ORF type:complete len:140 (-),score=27.14 TRINITY_DN5380_c0_g1_i1:27-446(-)
MQRLGRVASLCSASRTRAIRPMSYGAVMLAGTRKPSGEKALQDLAETFDVKRGQQKKSQKARKSGQPEVWQDRSPEDEEAPPRKQYLDTVLADMIRMQQAIKDDVGAIRELLQAIVDEATAMEAEEANGEKKRAEKKKK